MRPIRIGLLSAAFVFAAAGGYCLRWYLDYQETLAAAQALIEEKQRTLLAWQLGAVPESPLPPGVIPRDQARRGDLRLYVQMAKPVYATGEDVLIRVVLANASPDPMVLPADISFPECSLHLEVTRDGKRLPHNGPCFAGIRYPCQLIQLRPRETYGFVDSISSGWHDFDLSQPGFYTLRASYTVFVGTSNEILTLFLQNCDSYEERYAWSGTVTSEPVHFRILRFRQWGRASPRGFSGCPILRA